MPLLSRDKVTHIDCGRRAVGLPYGWRSGTGRVDCQRDPAPNKRGDCCPKAARDLVLRIGRAAAYQRLEGNHRSTRQRTLQRHTRWPRSRGTLEEWSAPARFFRTAKFAADERTRQALID